MLTPDPPPRPRNHRAHRTSSPEQAESLLGDVYVPHRLELPKGVDSVELEFVGMRVGTLTVGRVSYGRNVVVHTEPTTNIHIDITLRGRAEMASGTDPMRAVEVGAGAVFAVGQPAHVAMTEDCALLAITVPCATLVAELEHLLGQSLVEPLELGFDLDLMSPLGQTWDPLLKLMIAELRSPTALTTHPVAAKRVENLVLDAVLLSHDHNYREQLDRSANRGPITAVGRAIELIETHPTQDWSTESLAREVHLSVRALQAGFRRDIGIAPMDYLRQARLRHIRMALADSSANATSVRALAQRHGFTHLGRFAAAYRARYGETPVETLRRQPSR